MTRKMPDAEAKRSPLNLRTTSEMRQRLEAAAAENDRSITQEVERRLEQSFQDAKDPLPGIFSDEVRRALRGSPALAHLVEAVADTLLHTIRAAKDKGRDEIEVRTAARAALNVVADQYLWRGEKKETPVEGPLAPLGTRRLDYPPAHMGYEMANQRITWLSSWHEDDAAADKAEHRIRDLYSGTGRTVLMGPTSDEIEAAREAARSNARSALAAGDVEFEDQAQLHRYTAARSDPPQHASEDEAPPQSLKDIMGR